MDSDFFVSLPWGLSAETQRWIRIYWQQQVNSCWCFTPLQHLRLCQIEYQLVTVHTHGDSTVMATGKSEHWHHVPISHSITLSWYWANQSLPYPNNAECQARTRNYQFCKSLVWLNQELNSWSPAIEFRALQISIWLLCPVRSIVLAKTLYLPPHPRFPGPSLSLSLGTKHPVITPYRNHIGMDHCSCSSVRHVLLCDGVVNAFSP